MARPYPFSADDPLDPAAHNELFKGAIYGASSAGGDAYAITVSALTLSAYIAGQCYAFKADVANSAGATLSVNGLTAKAIKKNYNQELTGGDILAGQLVIVMYDSTNDCFQMVSPPGSGGGSVMELTADCDLTAGDRVGFSAFKDGTVAKAFKSELAPALPGTRTAISRHDLYFQVSSNKFVFINYYTDTSDTIRAHCVSVDRAAHSVSLGSEAVIATAFTPSTGGRNFAACKLDTDKFIVFYVLDSSTTIIKYRVGTISGTTITFGAEATFFTAASTVAASTAFRACQIGTDKGVLCFKAATTADGKLVAFTTSGTVATAGAGVTMGANTQANNEGTALVKIGTDKFVVATQNGGGTGTIYAQACTISGTTITAGTEAQINNGVANAAAMESFDLISPATDKFVLAFGITTGITGLVAATISGTTITPGTVLQNSSISDSTEAGLFLESASSFLLRGDRSSTKMIGRFSLSGTTITAGQEIGLDLWVEARGGFFDLGDGTPCIAYAGSADVSVWWAGMSHTFIGVALASASRGGLVNVQVSGVVSVLSGLIPGAYYLVGDDGALTTFNASTGTIDSIRESQAVLVAQSATQALIK